MTDDQSTNSTQDDQNTATEETPKATATIEDIGPARKSMVIQVPEDLITLRIQESYQQLNQDAVIPGFRRGRAPRRLIERRFGSNIRDDVRAQLISECYSQIVEENNLDVLGEPDVKDIDKIELPESGDLTFTVEIEISPEFDLPDFSAIAVEKTESKVTDEDVAEEITNMADRYGNMKSAGDSEVQEKDFVQADVRILAGEDAKDDADELLSQEGVYIMINGKSADYRGHVVGIVVEDLGKQLAGKKVDEQLRISMTGPAVHENDKIKEQPITIIINVKNIERVEPLSIETLVERMGVEDEQTLRDRIRENIEMRHQREQQAAQHKQIRKQLLEAINLELPEQLTSNQTSRILQRKAMDLAYQGVDEVKIEQQIAEMRENTTQDAQKELTEFFILDKAAKELEIDVSEQEVNGRIYGMAMQEGRRPEKMRQELLKSGGIQSIYLSIREQKTLDAILIKATGEAEAEAATQATEETETKEIETKEVEAKETAE